MALSFEFQVAYIKGFLEDAKTDREKIDIFLAFTANENYSEDAIAKALSDLNIHIKVDGGSKNAVQTG